MSHAQLASSVVMVRPTDFSFNPQTGVDNEFQKKPSQAVASQIGINAMQEFESTVQQLSNNGLEVIVLDRAPSEQQLPDAVFPNNWFSTREDGTLFIYPMKTPNRQAEVQIEPLCQALQAHHYQVLHIEDLRENGKSPALEGTGSLIFHYPSKQLFAALSERCDAARLQEYGERFDWKVWPFNTRSSHGSPIYHTNVLMSVGDGFAVICKQILEESESTRQMLNALEQCVDDIIVISEEQMGEGFCGNILHLKSLRGEPLIAMSDSAWKNFSKQQKSLLERYGTPVPCKIDTIEQVGGGSVRCMLAENFLPKMA